MPAFLARWCLEVGGRASSAAAELHCRWLWGSISGMSAVLKNRYTPQEYVAIERSAQHKSEIAGRNSDSIGV